MIGELRIILKDWPHIILAIQSQLNKATLQRLGKSGANKDRLPLGVMTGIQPKRAVLSILQQDGKQLKATTMARTQAVQIINIEELWKELD